MALDKCDPCTCITGYISTSKFYQDMEIIACAILTAVEALVPAAIVGVILPEVSKAFGSINPAFTNLGILDTTKKLTRLFVNNTTDANIEISTDGGATVSVTVPANSAVTYEFPGYVGAATTSVQIRYNASTVPSIGTAYFDGSY